MTFIAVEIAMFLKVSRVNNLCRYINSLTLEFKKTVKMNGFGFFEIYVNNVFVKLNNLENYETSRLFNSN